MSKKLSVAQQPLLTLSELKLNPFRSQGTSAAPTYRCPRVTRRIQQFNLTHKACNSFDAEK